MNRFGLLATTDLRETLHRAALARTTGVIVVSAPEEGGQVWLHDGHVAFAQVDTQPRLGTVLTTLGVVDEAGLARLRGDAARPADVRPVVTDAVLTVVQALTDGAVARLLALTQGGWELTTGEPPPLGVLLTRSVDVVLTAARLLPLVHRIHRADARGRWQPVAAGTGRVRLQPEDWEVLAAMTAPVSPAELSRRTGRPVSRVQDVLSDLERRGLVAELRPATSRPTGPVLEAAIEPPVEPPSLKAELSALASPEPRPVTAPRDPAPVTAPGTASAPPANGHAPVGAVVGAATSRSDVWTAQKDPVRAAALRRLIGAVRRL